MDNDILKNSEASNAPANFDAAKRYKYFLREVADEVDLWSLQYDDGRYVSIDDGEENYFYVYWPHRKFALDCVDDDWEGAKPVEASV